MSELLEQKPNEHETEIDPVPLDEYIFDNAERASKNVKDAQEAEAFRKTIDEGRRASFEYADSALDYLIGERKYKETDAEEEKHPTRTKFSALKLYLERFRAGGSSWPKESQELLMKIGTASLKYVIHAADKFDNALKQKISVGEAKKLSRIPDSIDHAFIQERIIKKIEQLPPEVRRNLLGHD